MSPAHERLQGARSGRRLLFWGRTLLALLALWATFSSVAAFLAVAADTESHAADWLGAWRTLFACLAIFVVARVTLLWLAEDLADRVARRRNDRELAARQQRDRRQVPREIDDD